MVACTLVRSLALVAALCPAVAAQGTFHVDALFGDDVTGDGSAGAPWKTITRAHLAPLQAGDAVSIAPGVYNAGLGEVFPITLKAGVRVSGSGPKETVVRGGGDDVLFQTSAGQVYFWLADLTLARAATGVDQDVPGGSDTYLILERVLFENNQIGCRGADTIGSYSQTAILNCFFRDNAIAVLAEENWAGFAETWLYVYGTTFVGNGEALRGTQLFGIDPRFTMKSSIVEDNESDLFLAGFTVVSPITGCLTAEPTLAGVNGNLDASPGLINPTGADPHVRTDSAALDRTGTVALWPPGPLGPSWWGGIPWAATFESVPDIDGHPRVDLLNDAGCDELDLPSFYAWGPAAIGSADDLVARGAASNTTFVNFSLGASLSIPTPYGTWKLDFPWHFLLGLALDGQGHHVSSLTWPSDPGLVGVDVYFQAVTFPDLAFTGVEHVRFMP